MYNGEIICHPTQLSTFYIFQTYEIRQTLFKGVSFLKLIYWTFIVEVEKYGDEIWQSYIAFFLTGLLNIQGFV